MSEAVENDAAELVRTLADVAPTEVFEFSKIQPDGSTKKYKVRLQMLRIDEDHQVFEDAQKYAKSRNEVPKDYGDLYREGQAVAMLTRALRKVEKRDRNDGTSYYPPLFLNEQQLRQSFTAPEMAQCISMYEIVRSKYGAIQGFHDEEFEQWVIRLGDQLRGAFFLPLLDSAHWGTLILRLAQELLQAWENEGRTLSTLQDSLTSDQQSSGLDTTSFTELPSASLANGDELPRDRMLSREEAAEVAKRVYGKKKE